MARQVGPREDVLRAALRRELDAVDGETLHAIARALERDRTRLEAGSWGSTDDGSGCLLTLAAWELGLDGGEALMARSVHAVRIPALFDEFWALVLARTGSASTAREITHRIVAEALADAAARDADAAREVEARHDAALGAGPRAPLSFGA
jgi:hypothetical protein